MDAGLGAVLTRLSPQGEVAHEEDIGEFAMLDHLRATGEKSDAPTFNYNMIDGSFMLAPVAAEWLLDDARGRSAGRGIPQANRRPARGSQGARRGSGQQLQVRAATPAKDLRMTRARRI